MSTSPDAAIGQLQQDRAALVAQRGAPPAGPDQAQILQDKQAALAPVEQAITAESANMPKPPGAAQLPQAPNKPLVDPGEYSKLSAALVAMAMIAGAKSNNWLGATASLNGALKGYMEGNQQKADTDWKRYQADYDKAVQQHKDQQQEYMDVLNNKKLSINEKFQQWSMLAAKYDDQQKLAISRRKSYDEMTKAIYDMDQHIATLSITKDKVDKAVEANAGFGGKTGELMASLAAKGITVPAGFRSKAQQKALFDGLIAKYPDKSADEIADQIGAGQIAFGAEKKETQTAAGIAGRVIVGESELEEFREPALAASNALPRGSFVPFNELQQKGEAALSDPRLKSLYQWTNAVLNAYDVVAARGGTDKDKRAENRKNLETADSPETYATALNVMMKEVAGAKKAAKRAEGRDNPAPPPSNTPAIGATENGYKFKGGDPANPSSWEKI